MIKSKLIAIAVSSAVTLALLWGIDAVVCFFANCINDVASNRAVAILGIPMLFLYIILSWLFVFPAMLVLRKKLGRYAASAVIALLFSLGMAILFHMPLVDGEFINTAAVLVPWFAVPWFFGGVLALSIWPIEHSDTQPEEALDP